MLDDLQVIDYLFDAFHFRRKRPTAGLLLGGRPGNDDPEAEHLHEDLRAELFGTTDVQEAIEGAIPWNPPDGPTPEGLEGSEDQRTDARDDM